MIICLLGVNALRSEIQKDLGIILAAIITAFGPDMEECSVLSLPWQSIRGKGSSDWAGGLVLAGFPLPIVSLAYLQPHKSSILKFISRQTPIAMHRTQRFNPKQIDSWLGPK